MAATTTLYIRGGRIRTIKPEFFLHEGLFDLEVETGLPIRVAWAGLWTQADKEGRFIWRPRSLKNSILPFDTCDFSRVLDALSTRGFIVRYEVENEVYGWIPKWHRHQSPNNREQESIIPPPDDQAIRNADIQGLLPMFPTRPSRVPDARTTEMQVRQGEGKGREEKINNTTLSSSVVSAEQSETVCHRIVMSNGKFYPVTQKHIQEWTNLYPAVDVHQELRKIVGWNASNPKRRKTQRGMAAHITNWLAQEQTKNAELNALNYARSAEARVGKHDPSKPVDDVSQCWGCGKKFDSRARFNSLPKDDKRVIYCTNECAASHEQRLEQKRKAAKK